ncbi:MAG: hypothetical protein AAFU74_18590, partial [Bacteroidota bacterium]
RKIKASTLMETLVASVLFVIIFMVSSLVLNTVFQTHMDDGAASIQQELLWLEYQYENQQLDLPYLEKQKDWTLSVIENSPENVTFQAVKGEGENKIVVQL